MDQNTNNVHNVGKVKTIVIVYDQMFISGGAAKIAIHSAVQLKKEGYRVIYFGAVGKPCDELIDNNIETICINEEHIASAKKLTSILKGIWNSNSLKEFEKLLSTLDPESTVVHVHGWTKALSSSVFLASYRKGFATLLTGHEYFTICQNGGLYNYKRGCICDKKPGSFACSVCNCDKRNYFNKIYRNIRQTIQKRILKKTRPGFIFITDFSKKLIEPYLYNGACKYFLTNFVEVEKHPRVHIEDNPYFLFIGRISDEKGVDLFCEAVSRCGVKGLVIGEGSMRQSFQEKYPGITFTGWKSSAEMQSYIKQARVHIVSSKWYETMGLTVIEMQQYGVPCIVPFECAASEFVGNGINGYLYHTANTEELCECIERLKDDSEAKRLSENGYNSFYPERYRIENYVPKLLDIYESAINNRQML